MREVCRKKLNLQLCLQEPTYYSGDLSLMDSSVDCSVFGAGWGRGRGGPHFNGHTAWQICFSQSHQYGIFALVSQMSHWWRRDNLVPRVLSYLHSRSVGQVGENPGNEVGIAKCWLFSQPKIEPQHRHV